LKRINSINILNFMVMKTKLFITAAAFLVFTALAGSQDKAANQDQQNTTNNRGVAWVDANNDGICDNFESPASGNFKGKGQGNMRGAGQGQGQGQRMGMGTRGMGPCGMGQGRGSGSGRNFVDANNNGICDLNETPVKK
jgi:hypothetical protein